MNKEEEVKVDVNPGAISLSNEKTKPEIVIEKAYELYQNKRIIYKDIYKAFHEYDDRHDLLIAKVTQNQVVKAKATTKKNFISFSGVEKIKAFIKLNSYNFAKIVKVTPFVKSKEAELYRLQISQPVELVLKIVLP